MTTRYALLNPANGSYELHDDLASLKAAMATNALEFFLLHTHGTPYSMVCDSPDGSETWRTPQGEEIVPPVEFTDLIEPAVGEFIESNQNV